MWSEKTKERKKRVVILFNDLLMETKQLKQDYLLFKRVVEITGTTVVAVDSGNNSILLECFNFLILSLSLSLVILQDLGLVLWW